MFLSSAILKGGSAKRWLSGSSLLAQFLGEIWCGVRGFPLLAQSWNCSDFFPTELHTCQWLIRCLLLNYLLPLRQPLTVPAVFEQSFCLEHGERLTSKGAGGESCGAEEQQLCPFGGVLSGLSWIGFWPSVNASANSLSPLVSSVSGSA